MTLAGESGLLDLEVGGQNQTPVGGDSVSGFHENHVTGNEVVGGDRLHLAVASHTTRCREHLLQGFEGGLGSILLDETDEGVGEHHHQHHDRCLQFSRHDETHDRRHEQDHDQKIAELVDETQESRSAFGLRQAVGTVLSPPGLDVGCGQARLHVGRPRRDHVVDRNRVGKNSLIGEKWSGHGHPSKAVGVSKVSPSPPSRAYWPY